MIKKNNFIKVLLFLFLSIFYSFFILFISVERYIPLIVDDKGSDDIYRLIALGEDFLSWGALIPWWFFKGLPYYISGLDNSFELFNLWLTYFVWAGFLVLVGFLILNLIGQSVLRWRGLIFISFFMLNPGTLYLGITGRFELASIFFLFLTIYYYIGRKMPFLLLLTGILGRPPLIISSFFIYLISLKINKFISSDQSLLKSYIILCVSMVVALFVLDKTFNYFLSQQYLFKEYNDYLRDFLNISSSGDLWKVFLKGIASFFFETVGYLKADFSLETFVGLQNIVRLCLIAILMYETFIRKNRFTKHVLNFYLIIAIPLILSVGFYQTRYLIPFDALLIFPLIFKKDILAVSHEKKSKYFSLSNT